MGYELDEIQEVIMYDKDTGKKIGSFYSGQIQATEESDKVAYTSTTIAQPPKPNIKFIISPGQKRRQKCYHYLFLSSKGI